MGFNAHFYIEKKQINWYNLREKKSEIKKGVYELSYKKSMFEEIKEILLEQLDIDEKDIKLDSKLIDDLGADSLDVAEIVSAVENKFNLEFSKEDLNKVETIQDIINLLEKNNKR